MYNSFYKNLIVPDTTVVNLSILEKFQKSFSPEFIGIRRKSFLINKQVLNKNSS